jgi:hypothetical protein
VPWCAWEGVEAVVGIYARELEAIMRQAGTPTIAAVSAPLCDAPRSRVMVYRRTDDGVD